MKPDEAMAAARAAADAAKAQGGYSERGELAVPPTNQITREKLLEWALDIEPDPDLVYSTRKLGGPITWVKKLMMRGLRQYHGQLISSQQRFNLQVVTWLTRLEDRVDRLEQEQERDRERPSSGASR